MRFFYTLLAFVLASNLSAFAQQGDPWLMKGHDARRTGQSLTNGPRSVDPSRTWTVEAPAGFVLNIGASVDENGAYFGSWGLIRQDSLGRDRRFWDKSDGKVYGFSLDGSPLWNDGIFDLDIVPMCYEFDGRERDGNDLFWCGAFNTYNVSFYNGTVEGQAAIDPTRGLMYVGRGDGKLYALVSDREEIAWRFITFNPQIPDDPDGGGEVVTSPLIGNDGTIYFATWGEGENETNAVYAVNPNGTLKWRWPSDTSLHHKFFASPALSIDGSTVYFATFVTDSIDNADVGKLYAFNTGLGENATDAERLKWEIPLSVDGKFVYTTTLAVGLDGTIYGGGAVIKDQNISLTYAVNETDNGSSAEFKWSTPYVQLEDGTQFVLGIALREQEGVLERMYVTTANFGTPFGNPKQEGKIYAISPTTGQVLASYDPSDDVPEAQGGINSPAIGADGTIYIGVRGRYKGLFVAERVNGHYFALDYNPITQQFSKVWNYEVDGYVEWNHPAIGPDGGLYAGSSVGGTGDSIQNAFHPQGTIPPGSSPKFYAIKDAASSVGDITVASGVLLEDIMPNPISGNGVVRFSLPSPAHVRLHIVDALGRHVVELQNGQLPSGAHHTAFNANALPAGTYYCRLRAGSEETVKKVVVWR